MNSVKKMSFLILMLSALFVSGCKKEDDAEVIVNHSESRFYPDTVLIVGNSLAAGLGSTFGGYERMFKDSGYVTINKAIGGQTTLQMINAVSAINDQISDSCLLVVDEITNDLYYHSTADTAFQRIKRYCSEIKANHKNIKIILVTPTPRSNSGTPSNFESNRNDVIRMIKSDNSFYDYLANAGEDHLIGYTGAETNLSFYYDLVHHTDSGYIVRGTLIYNSFNK